MTVDPNVRIARRRAMRQTWMALLRDAARVLDERADELLTYRVTRRAWGWSWRAWIDHHLVAVGWSRKEWHARESAQEVLFRRAKERR